MQEWKDTSYSICRFSKYELHFIKTLEKLIYHELLLPSVQIYERA